MKKNERINKILSYHKFYLTLSILIAVLMIITLCFDTFKQYAELLINLFLISAGFAVLCESGLRALTGKTLSFDYLPGLKFGFHPAIIIIVAALSIVTGIISMLIGFLLILSM